MSLATPATDAVVAVVLGGGRAPASVLPGLLLFEFPSGMACSGGNCFFPD
jgi:hypothetical protein